MRNYLHKELSLRMINIVIVNLFLMTVHMNEIEIYEVLESHYFRFEAVRLRSKIRRVFFLLSVDKSEKKKN